MTKIHQKLMETQWNQKNTISGASRDITYTENMLFQDEVYVQEADVPIPFQCTAVHRKSQDKLGCIARQALMFVGSSKKRSHYDTLKRV